MSKKHRDRNWAPAPQALPADAHVVDNHTHVASVVPFSRAMSHEAQAKGQPEVPVYSVDELLHQAQEVGVEGVIDCRGLLPDRLRAVGTDVLNGIAYDSKTGKIYLTGKNWPRLYEVKLIEKK